MDKNSKIDIFFFYSCLIVYNLYICLILNKCFLLRNFDKTYRESDNNSVTKYMHSHRMRCMLRANVT